uniref:Bulb-type lectin domain-containing protein n=1 Tax=Tetranychus urticae TaxID=32264 RepID=T1JRM3_TETUR
MYFILLKNGHHLVQNDPNDNFVSTWTNGGQWTISPL